MLGFFENQIDSVLQVSPRAFEQLGLDLLFGQTLPAFMYTLAKTLAESLAVGFWQLKKQLRFWIFAQARLYVVEILLVVAKLGPCFDQGGILPCVIAVFAEEDLWNVVLRLSFGQDPTWQILCIACLTQ